MITCTTCPVVLLLGVVLLSVCIGEECLLPIPDPSKLFPASAATKPQELSAFSASDYRQCVTQCCHGSEDEEGQIGVCNLVTFDPTKANCILYRCEPLDDCQFTPSSEVQIFADAQFVAEYMVNKSASESSVTSDSIKPDSISHEGEEQAKSSEPESQLLGKPKEPISTITGTSVSADNAVSLDQSSALKGDEDVPSLQSKKNSSEFLSNTENSTNTDKVQTGKENRPAVTALQEAEKFSSMYHESPRTTPAAESVAHVRTNDTVSTSNDTSNATESSKQSGSADTNTTSVTLSSGTIGEDVINASLLTAGIIRENATNASLLTAGTIRENATNASLLTGSTNLPDNVTLPHLPLQSLGTDFTTATVQNDSVLEVSNATATQNKSDDQDLFAPSNSNYNSNTTDSAVSPAIFSKVTSNMTPFSNLAGNHTTFFNSGDNGSTSFNFIGNQTTVFNSTDNNDTAILSTLQNVTPFPVITVTPNPPDDAQLRPATAKEPENPSEITSVNKMQPSEEKVPLQSIEKAQSTNTPLGQADVTSGNESGQAAEEINSDKSQAHRNDSIDASADHSFTGGSEKVTGSEAVNVSKHSDVMTEQRVSTTAGLISALVIGCFFFCISVVLVVHMKHRLRSKLVGGSKKSHKRHVV